MDGAQHHCLRLAGKSNKLPSSVAFTRLLCSEANSHVCLCACGLQAHVPCCCCTHSCISRWSLLIQMSVLAPTVL
jgi:hypothetical protein